MPEQGNESRAPLVVELNDWLERAVESLTGIRTPLVFISSVFTVALSMLLSFMLRFDFSFPQNEVSALSNVIILAVVIKMLSFYFFRLYEGMWKYVSIGDLVKIFLANLAASAVLLGIILFWHRSPAFAGFSRTVLMIDFIICFLAMSGKRAIVRIIRESAAKSIGGRSSRTLIVGDIEHVNGFLQGISSSPSRLRVVGILCEGEKI